MGVVREGFLEGDAFSRGVKVEGEQENTGSSQMSWRGAGCEAGLQALDQTGRTLS